ncbi:MAG: hypothetical protein WC813_01785 [Patescibacteria group bacterium]|jgi:hypothetical protein
METPKSLCSLIQAGRITWDDIVELHDYGTVKHAPSETRTPEEQQLARELHDTLAANHGRELQFESVVNALFTHLFDRSLSLLPVPFAETIKQARKAA